MNWSVPFEFQGLKGLEHKCAIYACSTVPVQQHGCITLYSTKFHFICSVLCESRPGVNSLEMGEGEGGGSNLKISSIRVHSVMIDYL